MLFKYNVIYSFIQPDDLKPFKSTFLHADKMSMDMLQLYYKQRFLRNWPKVADAVSLNQKSYHIRTFFRNGAFEPFIPISGFLLKYG